jgi:hypothetical protein
MARCCNTGSIQNAACEPYETRQLILCDAYTNFILIIECDPTQGLKNLFEFKTEKHFSTSVIKGQRDLLSFDCKENIRQQKENSSVKFKIQ